MYGSLKKVADDILFLGKQQNNCFDEIVLLKDEIWLLNDVIARVEEDMVAHEAELTISRREPGWGSRERIRESVRAKAAKGMNGDLTPPLLLILVLRLLLVVGKCTLMNAPMPDLSKLARRMLVVVRPIGGGKIGLPAQLQWRRLPLFPWLFRFHPPLLVRRCIAEFRPLLPPPLCHI